MVRDEGWIGEGDQLWSEGSLWWRKRRKRRKWRRRRKRRKRRKRRRKRRRRRYLRSFVIPERSVGECLAIAHFVRS